MPSRHDGEVGHSPAAHLLTPELQADVARLRLRTDARIEGRHPGAHTSRRHGSSVDFADHRDYVAGDDPRHIDRPAWMRTRKLLVRLHDAEDEATMRIVVDLSASMGFGTKADLARQVGALFVVLAGADQDRVRLLLAGSDGADDGVPRPLDTVVVGPWLRGPAALPAAELLLLAHAPPMGDDPAGDGQVALAAAVRRAVGEGGTGPIIVISDLLGDGWEEVVRHLGATPGDRILVHLVGRDELSPTLDGDLRLVDAETGSDIEIGITDRVLDRYVQTVTDWLSAIDEQAARQGAHVIRLVDDMGIAELPTLLRRAGVVTG